MARFRQLKKDQVTFERCLEAIQYVANEAKERWISSFIEDARAKGELPNTDVLLHWYKSFEDTTVSWERIVSYPDRASWEYENYDGIDICIGEGRNGRSEIFRSVGLPGHMRQQLENVDHDTLYRTIEDLVLPFFSNENIELRIEEDKR